MVLPGIAADRIGIGNVDRELTLVAGVIRLVGGAPPNGTATAIFHV